MFEVALTALLMGLLTVAGGIWRELRLLRLGIHASPENWLAKFKKAKPRKL